MFERPHHRRIAALLSALDAELLRTHHCLFGGGTLIALLHGEYRESRDVDFLVSDLTCYRALRGVVTQQGIGGLFRTPVAALREARMDQYGIRTLIEVEAVPIKFEIVLEARIALDGPMPSAAVCGVSALSPVDQVAEKLLANADRWADDAVDARDLIDLAMMLPDGRIPRTALDKASGAYSSIEADLDKAKAHIERPGRLARCMTHLQMTLPPALLLDRIRRLRPAPPPRRRGAP
ncbi:MAG: nucleotidyl transferase AbiEii/AbiGii toxin family protein [Burkholderiales bacterium]|nr:nucleotidyl transferase AbiEii/AbiGii toxin family protein [Burkholderiales bacterium]